MFYYIRFLKLPQIQKQNGATDIITTLFTITTDLGDAFLAEDVRLTATIQSAHSDARLTQTICWNATSREQKITFGPIRRGSISYPLQFIIRSTAVPEADLLNASNVPSIISAWSPWIEAGKPPEKLVLRRFKTGIGEELRVWEETGNSIARHVWDAALAAIIQFQIDLTTRDGGSLQSNQNVEFNALELGSGCGIVGIALSQMMPKCSVMLTDLDEVREIVNRNIATAQMAEKSHIEFQTLDWEKNLPAAVTSRRNDLVFLSDCTYNADALPALVQTIQNLVEISPAALVFVAWKKRCESEVLFFELMEHAGLAVQGEASCPLQGAGAAHGGRDGAAEIKIFRFQKRAQS